MEIPDYDQKLYFLPYIDIKKNLYVMKTSILRLKRLYILSVIVDKKYRQFLIDKILDG